MILNYLILIRLIRCQVNGLILKSNRCDLHFLVQRMNIFYSTAASETTVFWIIPLKLCGTLICIQWSAVNHRFVLLFTPFVNLHIQANWLVCPQVHCAELELLEVIRIWTLHWVYKTFASSSSSIWWRGDVEPEDDFKSWPAQERRQRQEGRWSQTESQGRQKAGRRRLTLAVLWPSPPPPETAAAPLLRRRRRPQRRRRRCHVLVSTAIRARAWIRAL